MELETVSGRFLVVWHSAFIATFTVTTWTSEVMQERMDSFILMHFQHSAFSFYLSSIFITQTLISSNHFLSFTQLTIKSSYFIYCSELSLSDQCYLIGRSVRWPVGRADVFSVFSIQHSCCLTKRSKYSVASSSSELCCFYVDNSSLATPKL